MKPYEPGMSTINTVNVLFRAASFIDHQSKIPMVTDIINYMKLHLTDEEVSTYLDHVIEESHEFIKMYSKK